MIKQLDELDRKIILATQEGLPIVPQPFKHLAEKLDADEQEIKRRFEKWKQSGAIRRVAAVPNHYKMGVTANGMSVWNVADDHAVELGAKVGELNFVSHCYLRPRHLPIWPYNLFAMVHAESRDTVEQQVEQIRKILQPHLQQSDILYSRKILKKTGFRLRANEESACFE